MSVTIVHTTPQVTFKSMAESMYSDAAIKRMALELVAHHVEAFIDMGRDYDEQFESFNECQAFFQSSQACVEDYVNDLIADFHNQLIKQVRGVCVNVKNVTISKDGFQDADVEVSCPGV